jgi:hypothetical protein
MALDIGTILFSLVGIIVALAIFVAPSLWIAGRLLAGKRKAKFSDALWIVIIGGAVFYFFNIFAQELLSSVLLSWLSYIVLLVIWLTLVKHFFDCGWLKALAISIIALIIAVIILFVIFLVFTIIGISTGWLPIGTQFNSF